MVTPGAAAYLHDAGVRTGGRTLRFAEEVWPRVCAAEALLLRPQAAVAVRRGEAHAVALLAREVPGRGGREDDELAASPSPAAAVLETSGVWGRRKRRSVQCGAIYITET